MVLILRENLFCSCILTDKAQFVHGSFLPGTTQFIDNATGLPATIGIGDTVEVEIGFTPKIFLAFDGATPGEAYMKMTGMPEDTALLFNGLVAASRIRFDRNTGTDANPVDNTFVTFNASFAVAGQTVTFIALG